MRKWQHLMIAKGRLESALERGRLIIDYDGQSASEAKAGMQRSIIELDRLIAEYKADNDKEVKSCLLTTTNFCAP
jgi:ethanolamine utilization microcompartment shell protein EutL